MGHLTGLAVAFRDAARKDLGPTTDTAPGSAAPSLPARWREELPRALGELAEAWKDPAAWTGMTRAGGVDLPGEIAGVVAADELVLHGWDLARAAGQEYAPDEAAPCASHGFLLAAAEDGDRGEGTSGRSCPYRTGRRCWTGPSGWAGATRAGCRRRPRDAGRRLSVRGPLRPAVAPWAPAVMTADGLSGLALPRGRGGPSAPCGAVRPSVYPDLDLHGPAHPGRASHLDRADGLAGPDVGATAAHLLPVTTVDDTEEGLIGDVQPL
ncbi:TIGR03086 family metal-binding protein [Streptomyces sp. NBC_00320]|uniref:TIGR03086 family metal-binding protein n=1 Tax=Streptomyces sp. NBC_00320 TaxID=2975711 RepID=UPI00338EAFEF